MRYPACEKLAIIQLVEHSHLPVRVALGMPTILLNINLHPATSSMRCGCMLLNLINLLNIVLFLLCLCATTILVPRVCVVSPERYSKLADAPPATNRLLHNRQVLLFRT
jgi:hypothetical protein